LRAASYARYSTDKQRETSVEDQHRLNRQYAAREGWQLVAEYSDREIKGSTPVALRAGGKMLLADVLAGRIDVLLIECLDRLSRDSVEQEQVVRRCERRGLRIIGIADHYDSTAAGRKMTRKFRGIINEIYLDDLRAKVHRGLSGQIERGFYAGGLAYGYRSMPVDVDAQGNARGHRLEIVESEAAIVREIFARFASGESCQRIAAALNARGASGPRGGTWSVSAIYGTPRKGTGILNNELYTGRYVWNRSQWVTDPDTGRRQRLERPRAEWMIDERAELAIVEPALWERAKAAQVARSVPEGKRSKGRAPSTLLGGLMRCGLCGGALIAVNARAYGCGARKDRGPHVCAGLLVRRDLLEDRVIEAVTGLLLEPRWLAELQAMIAEELAESKREAKIGEGDRRRRRGEIEQEIANLVDALAKVGYSEAVHQRLVTLEAELERLQRAGSGKARIVVTDLAARYKREIDALAVLLRSDVQNARPALQEVLGEARLTPATPDKGFWAEIALRADRLLIAAAGDAYLGGGSGGPLSTPAIRVRII